MALIVYIICFVVLNTAIGVIMHMIANKNEKLIRYIGITSYTVSFLFVFILIVRQEEYQNILVKNWSIGRNAIYNLVLALGLSMLIYIFRMLTIIKKTTIKKIYFQIGEQSEFFYKVVIAPVCEEILYRNLLLPSLLENYCFMSAAFLVSLLFAISHLQIKTFFYYFVSSFIFSGLFYITGSVLYTICSHMAYNFLCCTIVVQTESHKNQDTK